MRRIILSTSIHCMRKLLLPVSFVLAAAALISWGVKGHRAVALIAQNHLHPAAREAVRVLLGDTSLADISSWPDEVLRQPEYRHTAPWHYLNLPLGLTREEFDAKIENLGSENVYGALRREEEILESTSSTRPEKAEALKFIVHFIGDLHQPMHVSRAEDKGGNTIQLNYDKKGTNLHALWDSKLIDHEGLSPEQMAAQYDHATAAEIRQWQSQPLMEWLWESYQ
ncbi:MAG TPA: S1/P1 nuclease, partial [Puia sp.]|nr:S1/P1 nuclease [Puia sp.]